MQWASAFDALAGDIAHDLDVSSFRDEMGHRIETDQPFLAHLTRTDPGPAPSGRASRLWWCVARGDRAIDVTIRDEGPLFERGAIEVWTEDELCALHALSHLAGDEASLKARVRNAVEWHIEHLQPDNATGRPWAIHLFASHPDAEAQVHAEMMLHACQTQLGVPDRRARCILLDAARVLRRSEARDAT